MYTISIATWKDIAHLSMSTCKKYILCTLGNKCKKKHKLYIMFMNTYKKDILHYINKYMQKDMRYIIKYMQKRLHNLSASNSCKKTHWSVHEKKTLSTIYVYTYIYVYSIHLELHI